MIVPRIGELLRNTRTGDIYKVEMTKDERVTLQSLDGSSQILTERRALNLFYEALPQPAVLCARRGGRGGFHD
jgi:hypothetical protein